ncbi:MAG: hypothetical protein BMS9Abin33_1039 [Gammaproteobacteria bacterium]|nr:MAG: hypothetical protein BMS9Abin33_1039 [Gammaproteobacteria bacterium]
MRKMVVAGVLLVLTSCATPPKGAHLVDSPKELPSVKAEKSKLLSQLTVGMLLSEFKRVVPGAYVAGQSRDITAYELVHIQKYVTQSDIDRQNWWVGAGSPNARTRRQVLWFYFYDDRLVQWGNPQDWPERPDFILEKRIR